MPSGASPSGPTLRQTCRVLIVEDDPFARRALATLLTLQGHHVVSTASADEALELLRRPAEFTHVVVDLMLGDSPRDGTAVLLQLREMRHPARVAITSSTADPELISRAMSFSPDRFYEKPLQIERILEWLRPRTRE